ncbi:hypothetical protein SBDP1_250013 [Syntrophobacter sp. SbD1]|nr:hypothetical protein SBDP1_250013 [Syntrophobacter sp. SbD1]
MISFRVRSSWMRCSSISADDEPLATRIIGPQAPTTLVKGIGSSVLSHVRNLQHLLAAKLTGNMGEPEYMARSKSPF